MNNDRHTNTVNQESPQPALRDVVRQLGEPRILVLGDIGLHRSIYGRRQSSDDDDGLFELGAIDDEEVNVGGAACCAAFIAALGGRVDLSGAVGDDQNGRTLRALLREIGIDDSGVFTNRCQPTSVQERIVARRWERESALIRIARATQRCLPDALGKKLRSYLSQWIPRCQAVVICDRQELFCEPNLISYAIAGATAANVPVLVEPPSTGDYSRYTGATLLRFNRSKAEKATGKEIVTIHDAEDAGQQLCERYKIPLVVITLGRDGIMLSEARGRSVWYRTEPQEVCDSTGAGFAVLAVLAMCLATGVPLAVAADLARVAGFLEVQKRGAVPITCQEILDALPGASDDCPVTASPAQGPKARSPDEKIVSLHKLLRLLAKHRGGGQRIVLVAGAFEIFHRGHLACLQEAATFGDVLVVAIDSDRLRRRRASKGWPIPHEEHRASMVAALECVDYVLVHHYDRLEQLLTVLRPDVLAKGDCPFSWDSSEDYGGKVRLTKEFPGCSTLKLLEQAAHMLQIVRAEATSNDNVCQTPTVSDTAQKT